MFLAENTTIKTVGGQPKIGVVLLSTDGNFFKDEGAISLKIGVVLLSEKRKKKFRCVLFPKLSNITKCILNPIMLLFFFVKAYILHASN